MCIQTLSYYGIISLYLHSSVDAVDIFTICNDEQAAVVNNARIKTDEYSMSIAMAVNSTEMEVKCKY